VLRDCLITDFVYYYLQHAKKLAVAMASGTTFLEISGKKAAQIPIPIAPLAEQRRIVAEIEKQFTRLDAGVAPLRRVQANLKRYRAAVLKAACEGRLVPTEAELAKTGNRKATFETGEALLARILTARRQKWQNRGKYKDPAAPDTDYLSQVPAGWAMASVDQLSVHITSGSRDWAQFYNKGTGTFILAQNVRPMRLDLSERQSVDAPKGDAETERTRVRQSDILVTIVGAKTGDVCRVPVDLQDHFVCQSVALLRPVLSGSSKFTEMYLASQENGQSQWRRYIYGQGRPHLSFEQLRMTAIRLPPLAEQTRIVAEVERRLSVIEELESVVSANLLRSTRLRQAILHKAFSGTLANAEASG
jgi:type I restriction enzyme, S subunit